MCWFLGFLRCAKQITNDLSNNGQSNESNRMNPADEPTRNFPGMRKCCAWREVDGLRVGAVPSYSVPKSTTYEAIRESISRGDCVNFHIFVLHSSER